MVKARKWVVKTISKGGYPKREDYEIVEEELPPLKEGEVLVKAEWISVDPYLWLRYQRLTAPYDQFSFQVGIIEESKNPEYPVGSKIVTHKGWCDYSVVDPNENITPGEKPYKLPDMKGLSESLGIGSVGMPGAAAYFGLQEICKAKPGETVVITTAAGAIGSVAGQIAKIRGCKVIGFTGSDKKVEYLEKELGLDKAFNYKTVDAVAALKEAAPQGIDCFFDHVGGELGYQIISQMNNFGRIYICGCISAYDGILGTLPKATVLQPAVLMKNLTIQGFPVWGWRDRWPEAFNNIVNWIKSGQLVVKETVTEGFDNLYDAFIGVLKGDNIGKAVVKV